MLEPLAKIPGGLRYYTGAEARLRRTAVASAMTVFDGWGYEEIVTPTIDYYALFERGMGREEASRAFRFADADGRLLALRPDVTSTVARAAATLLSKRARPLRLCYAAPVFRRHARTQMEWRRETVQLGCELIGPTAPRADAEILSVAFETLERLRLAGSFCITLNSVEIFNGVAENLSLSQQAREQMRELLDVRAAADLEDFLAARQVSTQEERAAFVRLTRLSGKREILDEARRVLTNPRSVAALDALEEIWIVVERLGLTESFEIDLGDVSGLDYYTGLTFKIYVAGAGARVGGGGRYDRLTENFGRAEPSIGFVLDLDALTEVLLARDRPNTQDENSTNGVQRLQADETGDVFVEARERRMRGERVKIDFGG